MKVFWSLRGGRRNEARESTPCRTHPGVSFHHLIRQIAPGIMIVNRLDFNIWVEGVFVEEHRASSVVGHVEPICQNIMVNIFNCFLQCDDVPLACDLFLNSTFFSTSRSWIPVVDAESLLHRRTTRHVVVEAVHLRRCIVSPCGYLAKFCDDLLNIDHMSF